MKTGDTVHDGTGRSFQVGQILGRGLWGKTYTAREEPGGNEWVIKVPLGPEAFAQDGENLARICREIGLEQGRVLGQGPLIRPEARFTTDKGIPVLVLPRCPTSLRARMAPGAPLEALLIAIADVAGLLKQLDGGIGVHGNLRPENVLATGSGGWVLSDPATPTLLRHLPALARARELSLAWLPPEARGSHDRPLSDPSVDTHALAAALLIGALTPHDGAPPALPDDGLDKATLVALKDSVRNRLKDEATNARFHARLSDRLSTLLNRALSREISPSPPYRFSRPEDLQRRVLEVAALARPRVSHVGRLLLDRPPGSDAFTTEEEVVFTCSVGCSAGVETHEDIGCGIAVFDGETGDRLRQVPCSYTVDRHPSGRYRFGFHIAGLQPGGYRVRVAFTIRDSGDEPSTSEVDFAVHPAAGYVPPPAEPEPQAIAFARNRKDDTVTEVTAGDAAPPESPVATDGGTGAPTAVPEAASTPGLTDDIGATSPPPDDKATATSTSGRMPRPIAPPGAAPPPPSKPSVVPAAAPSASAAAGVAITPPSTASTAPAEPEYRGAGRWTDLPLPGATIGNSSADPFADDLTEPADPALRGDGPFDRLIAMTEGDSFKLFIGLAVAVILVLILALFALH